MTDRATLAPRIDGIDGKDAARERAHGLLRDLLAEVAVEAPATPSDAVRAPSSLDAVRSRRAGRGPVVAAALAVGVLSFGGVAAASTQVAVGNPLHGLGSVVRTAAGSLTGSGSSESAGGPRADARTTAGATPESAARGKQVDALLRAADEFHAAGRVDEAWASLAEAERALAETSDLEADPAHRDRAVALRARMQAGRAGTSPGDTTEDPSHETTKESVKDTSSETAGDPGGVPPAVDPDADGFGNAVPRVQRPPSTSEPAPVKPAPAPKASAKKQAPTQQDRATAPAGTTSGESAGKGGSGGRGG